MKGVIRFILCGLALVLILVSCGKRRNAVILLPRGAKEPGITENRAAGLPGAVGKGGEIRFDEFRLISETGIPAGAFRPQVHEEQNQKRLVIELGLKEEFLISFTILFDQAKFSPEAATNGGLMGPDNEVILFALLDRKGELPVSIARIRPDRNGYVTGAGAVAEILFEKRPQGSSKTVSKPVTADLNNVIDLVSAQGTLTWNEARWGDLNNDGFVKADDIGPLAFNFGKNNDPGSPDYYKYASYIDGNRDGIVGAGDISPIAIHFGESTGGYNIYRADDSTGANSLLFASLARPFPEPDPENGPFGVSFASLKYSYEGFPPNEALDWGKYYRVFPFDALAPPQEASEVGSDWILGETLTGRGNWWMFGHDPMHTRRSSYIGSQTGALKWRFQTGGPVTSSPSIGIDGTVYVGSMDNYIYAINSDGTLRWRFQTGLAIQSSPAIGSDGTVYVGSNDYSLYAINPDGTLKWRYQVGGAIWSSPAIGSDGTIYVGANDYHLHAVNPDGSQRWEFPMPGFVRSSPRIGPDGTVYVEGKAISSDGSEKGNFSIGYSSGATDLDGTHYYANGQYLVADEPDGTFEWRFETGEAINSEPALGVDGTVYVGSDDNYLYAVNSDGSLKWRYGTGGNIRSSPAIDLHSTTYVGSDDGYLYAFGEAGNVPPVAELSANPTAGEAPLNVALTAGRSYDPDGNVLLYEFDFTTDGVFDNSSTTPKAQFIYDEGGNYRITLRVIDEGGAANTTYVDISVAAPGHQYPVASVRASPTWGEAPLSVTFSGYGSYDPDGTIVLFEWDFETDGVWDGDKPTPEGVQHVYDSSGSYRATLRVTDNDGLTASNSISIEAHTGPGDWRMFGREPTHNRRSPFLGSQTGKLKWRYRTGGPIESSPAIGSDGTLYVAGSEDALYALDSNGTLKWRNQNVGSTYSSPAIGSDGTVYVGSDLGLNALNPDGSFKWRYLIYQYFSTPTIGPDGTIYVGYVGSGYNDRALYAFNNDGIVKWRYQMGGEVYSSPAIGSDGTIYVGSWDKYINALDPDGTLKWRYQVGGAIWSSPAIGSDGTIYVGSDDSYLYALNRDGTLKWSFKTDGGIRSSPAIGSDGTVYIGSWDDYLYAINPDGSIKWRYKTGWNIGSSPAIGLDGTVYFGSVNKCVYALNPTGTLKWRYETEGSIYSSPAIGLDGSLYIGSNDGYLYAFSDPPNDPPVAVPNSDPLNGVAPLIVNFSAERSYDPDSRMVLYEWDFESDGIYDWYSPFSTDVQHTFDADGVYKATLRVTDDGSLSDTNSVFVFVGPDRRGDWWMLGRNPAHTSQSPILGPQTPTLRWSFQAGAPISYSVIASDGTIYFTSGSYLYAITEDGQYKWSVQADWWLASSPAIGRDGTVYTVLSLKGDSFLCAVNPDGTFKWKANGGYSSSSPAIGEDGTIYWGLNSSLYAIFPDGTIKWTYATDGSVDSSPAIGSDGTIYVGSGDNYLYALGPNGSLKWRYRVSGPVWASPAIGADGTICITNHNPFGDAYVYALNPDGTLKWKCDVGWWHASSPSIAQDGTIYVRAREMGGWDDHLSAVNPDGTLKWQKYEQGYPVIGSDGTIFLGGATLRALSPDGTLKWQYKDGLGIGSTLMIGPDGTLYVGSDDGYLYAIGD